MPIPGILHPLKSREAGWDLHVIEVTFGAGQAISSVDGKGMATDGVATGQLGGVVDDGTGLLTITLPGYGGVQKIVPLTPVIVDGSVGDVKSFLVTDRTTSARTVSYMFVDGATDAAEDLTSGSVVFFPFLVKNGSAE